MRRVYDLTRVEPPARLELTTCGLQIRRSTSCSYGGLSSFHNHPGVVVTIIRYTPAWNLSSAGTTPLFLKGRLAVDHFRSTPGLSRNFSALRRCNRSHPLSFIGRGQLIIISCRRRVAPPAAEAFFPCVSFQRARRLGAWWNSQDSNLGHYSSSHLSYCSMVPGTAGRGLFACYLIDCLQSSAEKRKSCCSATTFLLARYLLLLAIA